MIGRRIVCFATQGTGHHEETRILELLADFDPTVLPFDRSAKPATGRALLRELRRLRPDLVVMEGTGLAGGLAVMAARLADGTPYLVSSGDAVGPYVGMSRPELGPPAQAYERVLFQAQRRLHRMVAISRGPRAHSRSATRNDRGELGRLRRPGSSSSREDAADRLGIAGDALVFGIVGSLVWNPRVGYCYGHELVRALARTDRQDIHVLLVGDGSGRRRDRARCRRRPREARAPCRPRQSGRRFGLSQRNGRGEPASERRQGWLVSLHDEAERVPRRRAAGRDRADPARLRPRRRMGVAPAGEGAVGSGIRRRVGGADDGVTPAEVDDRSALVPREAPLFSKERQRRQVAAFVRDILAGSVALDAWSGLRADVSQPERDRRRRGTSLRLADG